MVDEIRFHLFYCDNFVRRLSSSIHDNVHHFHFVLREVILALCQGIWFTVKLLVIRWPLVVVKCAFGIVGRHLTRPKVAFSLCILFNASQFLLLVSFYVVRFNFIVGSSIFERWLHCLSAKCTTQFETCIIVAAKHTKPEPKSMLFAAVVCRIFFFFDVLQATLKENRPKRRREQSIFRNETKMKIVKSIFDWKRFSFATKQISPKNRFENYFLLVNFFFAVVIVQHSFICLRFSVCFLATFEIFHSLSLWQPNRTTFDQNDGIEEETLST